MCWCGSFGGGVDEYDANTGAYIKTYNPGGGAQWAGIYRPNGNVFIGSWNTQDVREYDGNTGAFIRVLFPIIDPADMEYGPNGHLYVCSYGGYQVIELDEVTGVPYNFINLPFGERANDVAFLPGGRILVTAMGMNQCYVFDSALNLINQFAGTGWQRPHGVVISPHTGNILIADGVTTQVHEFDPNTYAELNADFLTPGSERQDRRRGVPPGSPDGGRALDVGPGEGALALAARTRRTKHDDPRGPRLRGSFHGCRGPRAAWPAGRRINGTGPSGCPTSPVERARAHPRRGRSRFDIPPPWWAVGRTRWPRTGLPDP